MKHREVHPLLDMAAEGCFGCKIAGVKTHMTVLKIQREYGLTGAEMAKENRESFKADKGYYPESATRWI